jgi:hypothetical protein
MVLYEPIIASAGDAATTFFEMANSNTIEYRCSGGSLLTIKQDRNIKNCTGGIVWETAFLLGTFLEVGAQIETDTMCVVFFSLRYDLGLWT